MLISAVGARTSVRVGDPAASGPGTEAPTGDERLNTVRGLITVIGTFAASLNKAVAGALSEVSEASGFPAIGEIGRCFLGVRSTVERRGAGRCGICTPVESTPASMIVPIPLSLDVLKALDGFEGPGFDAGPTIAAGESFFVLLLLVVTGRVGDAVCVVSSDILILEA